MLFHGNEGDCRNLHPGLLSDGRCHPPCIFQCDGGTAQDETDEARKYYQGLPITSISIILPLFCTLRPLLGHRFLSELHICILTVGLLFIINFQLKKPGWKMLTFLISIVALALIKIYFF